jgi:hypothetical protein
MGFFSIVGSILKANSRSATVRDVLQKYFHLNTNKGTPIYDLVLDAAIGAEGTGHNEYDIALVVLNLYSMQLDCEDQDVRKSIVSWIGAGSILIEKGLVSDPARAEGALSMMADQIDFGDFLEKVERN